MKNPCILWQWFHHNDLTCVINGPHKRGGMQVCQQIWDWGSKGCGPLIPLGLLYFMTLICSGDYKFHHGHNFCISSSPILEALLTFMDLDLGHIKCVFFSLFIFHIFAVKFYLLTYFTFIYLFLSFLYFHLYIILFFFVIYFIFDK